MIKSFGEIIREARKLKGYSQVELAELVGVSHTYLSKVENDKCDYYPKEEVIRSLSDYLDLDHNKLVFLSLKVPKRFDSVLAKYYDKLPDLFYLLSECPDCLRTITIGELLLEAERFDGSE